MIHSFLMLGQSNMAGRGEPGTAPPIRDSRLFMLRNGRWQPLAEPVNCDRPFSGLSPAVSFALAYAREYHADTGLIPCADGGTSLDDWAPGGQLYLHALCQGRLAGRVSRIVGVLWHQGESDSHREQDALAYAEKLTAILDGLTGELGIGHVPVILGELGDYLAAYPEGKYRCYTLVNEALHRLAASRPHWAVAPAGGLRAKADGLHFDGPSCRELGLRYFEEYKKLRSAPGPGAAEPTEGGKPI